MKFGSSFNVFVSPFAKTGVGIYDKAVEENMGQKKETPSKEPETQPAGDTTGEANAESWLGAFRKD